jgi:hypothetical protein
MSKLILKGFAPPDDPLFTTGTVIVPLRTRCTCHCGVAIPPWVDLCEKHFYEAHPDVPRQNQPPTPWYCDPAVVLPMLRAEPDLKDLSEEELQALCKAHPMLPCEVGIEQALRRMMENQP